MSEPTDLQLDAAWHVYTHTNPGIWDREHMRAALEAALEASPSTEAIIEIMARAIFNAHNRVTPEDSPWHIVPEETREIFRGRARHELEVQQKA